MSDQLGIGWDWPSMILTATKWVLSTLPAMLILLLAFYGSLWVFSIIGLEIVHILANIASILTTDRGSVNLMKGKLYIRDGRSFHRTDVVGAGWLIPLIVLIAILVCLMLLGQIGITKKLTRIGSKIEESRIISDTNATSAIVSTFPKLRVMVIRFPDGDALSMVDPNLAAAATGVEE